ncbi:glycosyltransferase family 4 protein [Desulfoprunum benzoelyticum]|nr:glycosyltransferase family 4 protein [Desulfoprunum benzoelyticum]
MNKNLFRKMNKANVLIVTRNLPPLVGGMERLIWHAIDELRSDYQVQVVGPSGCKDKLPPDVNVIEVQLSPMFFFLLGTTLGALRSVVRHRPNIIFAGSGLTAPIVWIFARLSRARCIVYLHGLDVKVQHSVYRSIWLPFFQYFDHVLVNSRYTKQLALEARVPSECISILHPGVEMPDMADVHNKNLAFRSRYNFGQSPIMLCVGRITPRKGLLYFVENILPNIISEAPKSILVVIGDDPVDALQTVTDERARIRSVLIEKGLKNRVNFLGNCSDEELDNAYFAADVLVFPVQQSNHDIEGFGMVAVEAAAHGLPTVAFSVGGVPDAVSDGCCGRLIRANDNISFAQAVIELIKEGASPKPTGECRKFAELFQWNEFGSQLRRVFHNVESGGSGIAGT